MTRTDCWLEVEELYVEDERGLWRNFRWPSIFSIGVLVRTDQTRLLSFFHLSESLIPALDYTTHTNLRLEGSALLHRRVENGAIFEGAVIVSSDKSASRADLASTFFLSDYLEFLLHFYFNNNS